MKIIEKEFNVETGEETITEREETVTEKALREKLQAEFEAEKAEVESKQAQRLAIAEKLGLTIDELKVLLG